MTYLILGAIYASFCLLTMDENTKIMVRNLEYKIVSIPIILATICVAWPLFILIRILILTGIIDKKKFR